MPEKEQLALSDKSAVPDDEMIFSIIGERKVYWHNILKSISEKHSNISWSWNYYNDGKQWLFKLVQKKKTVLWGAILATGQFRMTFYFADKAEPLIDRSDLPLIVKDSFRTAKRYGAIRPATILVDSAADVDSVLMLADIRINLK